jgi:hypothetical protein
MLSPTFDAAIDYAMPLRVRHYFAIDYFIIFAAIIDAIFAIIDIIIAIITLPLFTLHFAIAMLIIADISQLTPLAISLRHFDTLLRRHYATLRHFA